MNELDLHGKTHEEAELEVERWLCSCDLPCKIITGNSFRMRDIVLKEVQRLGLFIWDTDFGYITVIEKKI
jgi:DNA-nicking Smr family endonuclease